ncbi:MAG: HAD-IA family hydrolase [Methanoregula sp.]|jgi:HAD superfamily hydrolase (TIGR01549 family)|uniref:HAD family hydrolase n=1 Tax=Methanoregula sp. TaxID=2052170 RepID=UPI003D12A856
MIRAIILDFDGVILESVEVKTDAFRALFSFCPENVDEIVSFHRKNGGMSRFDKFDYIYRNILRVPLTDQKKQELSEEFSALVFKKIVSAPFVPGAFEFIKEFHRSIPLYIVSATPEKELSQIVSLRGLTPYFQRVYGSPRKKSDCIEEIIMQSRIPRSEIVFVGDARNDLEAAVATNIRFFGREKPGDKGVFSQCRGVEGIISDLTGLKKYIEEKA